MLVDLHCHSKPLSACSALLPEEVVDLARERGLDAICLTEHDRPWDATSLDALSRRTGFLVFPGIELSLAEGHLLGFGLPPILEPLTSLAAAARVAGDAGLLYLAHPARDNQLKLTPALLEHCASIEACNGSDSSLANAAAAGLASKFRLPGIGGSDCHTAAEVGKAATLFERPVHTVTELVEELRAGRYTATAL